MTVNLAVFQRSNVRRDEVQVDSLRVAATVPVTRPAVQLRFASSSAHLAYSRSTASRACCSS